MAAAIYLGRAGQMLTIKILDNNDKTNRDKLVHQLKVKKIPIYKADTFLYFETPVSSLELIYKMWKEDEIMIDLKAKPWVDAFKFNSFPLKDLPKNEIKVFPKDDKVLKPHQREFLEIDLMKTNLACFLDTGSGKCLCLILRAMHYKPTKPIIVFTTQGNFADWSRDIRSILQLDCGFYTGTKAQREKIDLYSKPFLVSNYEQAVELSKKINPDSFDGIILDEADQIGNPSGKKHKAVVAIQKLIKDRKFTLTATGTPLEESLEPLWGLLYLTDPNVAGKKDEFLNKFQGFKRRITLYTKQGITYQKNVDPITKNLPELKKLLSTIAFRVDVSESFKFQSNQSVIKLGMTDRQWLIYNEIKEEIKELAASKELFKGNPLPKFGELFRVAEGIWGDEIHSVKYHEICDRLKRTTMKTILWSGYVDATEAYYKAFSDRAVIYNGSRSAAYKELAKLAFQGAADEVEEKRFYELKEKFKDFPFSKPGQADLFIATSSLSGGRGLNLPAAEQQIWSSISLSGRAVKQSSGRNKRQNTTHEQLYETFYVSDNTIDIRYLLKVFSKIENASNVLDGAGSLVQIKARELLRMI